MFESLKKLFSFFISIPRTRNMGVWRNFGIGNGADSVVRKVMFCSQCAKMNRKILFSSLGRALQMFLKERRTQLFMKTSHSLFHIRGSIFFCLSNKPYTYALLVHCFQCVLLVFSAQQFMLYYIQRGGLKLIVIIDFKSDLYSRKSERDILREGYSEFFIFWRRAVPAS